MTLDSLYIGVPIGAFFCFLFIFFSFLNARGCKTGQVFQTDSFILSDLDWRCSNDAYADHAGDAVLVSCVGIRIFDGTDFYVCIFILYVGDQKEWFPDRILHSYCGGNGDQCCHRSIYPGTGYYPVCR